jgi:choline dehydrogenase-like flavoprotein
VPEQLTPAEKRLRGLLIGHAILSAILAVGYLVDGNTDVAAFMPNSFAKDLLFVAISWIGAADVRRRHWTALVIAFAYVALVIGQIVTLAWGGAPDMYGLSGTTFLLGWMAIDLVLIAWFAWWWWAAVRAAHQLSYLNPIAFLGLVALAEVLVEGGSEAITAEKTARNVDGYLASLHARGKRQVHVALTAMCLWPLLTARPPLPALRADTREAFLHKRFIEEIAKRRVLPLLRPYMQGAIRTGAQMSYLGYYSDPDTHRAIGYERFVERPGGHAPGPLPEPPLRTLRTPPRTPYDTIVVGSGAAGSVLAYRYAESGRSVLVVERGPHADPRDFTEDEIDQYLYLYNEGALELATDFYMQVLQGMCVGGGTTINNALCLAPPAEVLDDWAGRGLDRPGLEEAIGQIRTWLSVTPIPDRTRTRAAERFAAAVRDLGLPGELERMEANITDRCAATGYCNIGCAYGGKKAALDFILPSAQRLGHRLDVLPDAEVQEILRVGDRATGVVGRHGGERFALMADEIVVAAGPIASSYLLQRSGIGGDQVGEGLHFNINSPLTADFHPEEVIAFDGIQMSDAYVAPGAPPPYLVETWFNPPATQALATPGWFGEHFENMSRYRNLACAGVLVGTTCPGRVKPGSDGPEIEYEASDADMDSMIAGLKDAGRIWLHAGAARVMPATFAFNEYRTVKSLDAIESAVKERGDLFMTSAHPQGGNALGTVVDQDFRVRGLANVYLCDASVFPTSVHVNPQLTVMGMAQYAAGRLLR